VPLSREVFDRLRAAPPQLLGQTFESMVRAARRPHVVHDLKPILQAPVPREHVRLLVPPPPGAPPVDSSHPCPRA